MKRSLLALTATFLFVSCSSQAEPKCLGDDQPESVERYSCLDVNAFLSLSPVEERSSHNFKVSLYKLDQEVVLAERPANYALVISSFDIGEPAVLVGLKTQQVLRLEAGEDMSSSSIKVVNLKNVVIFNIAFKGYDDLTINGKSFSKK